MALKCDCLGTTTSCFPYRVFLIDDAYAYFAQVYFVPKWSRTTAPLPKKQLIDFACVAWAHGIHGLATHSRGSKLPPYNSEYPGFLRVRHLIQTGTQSSIPQTPQIGYLLTEVMKFDSLSPGPRRKCMSIMIVCARVAPLEMPGILSWDPHAPLARRGSS